MISFWKKKLLQSVFDRHMRWRLKELLSPEYPVLLDYPLKPEPRYGQGKPAHVELHDLLTQGDDRYKRTLEQFATFIPKMQAILEVPQDAGSGSPFWSNGYFSSLDAIALYGLLGVMNPNLYMEVGSGNSTKFARQAVRDLGLRTRILSIDPAPRAEVDALCDTVVRQPLEDVDLRLFDQLESGDILFVDNSHRVFQNSDVAVFFMEILPRIKPGVLVHIHDIFLPYDYPREWAGRHYSEQYLLAAYLLGGSRRLEMLLPLAYMSEHAGLVELVNQMWSGTVFQRSFDRYRRITGGYIGVSCWLRRT